MNFRQKTTGLIFLLGIIAIISMSILYYIMSYHSALDHALVTFKVMAQEKAETSNRFLNKKTQEVNALTVAPIIASSLYNSNKDYAHYNTSDRDALIQKTNDQWKASNDINDAVIQNALTHPAATYLTKIQTSFPGQYGEIFLTNKYGALVASTGKLSTFSHAHKYWWKAAYNKGKGMVFFDDRGFDESVQGYVLGIVVPIQNKSGEIIGLLKSNLNILSELQSIIKEGTYSHTIFGIKLIRADGTVILEKGKKPLSSTICPPLLNSINNNDQRVIQFKERGVNKLASYAPVTFTSLSKTHLFGGRSSTGEATTQRWYITISHPTEKAIEEVHFNIRNIIGTGVFLSLIFAGGAWILAGRVTKPINTLIEHTKKIGEGDFITGIDESPHGEIGVLMHSFNDMAQDLHKTMISRDELLKESKQREKAENERKHLITAIEQTVETIVITDTDGIILYANPAFEKTTGYTCEEALGENPRILKSEQSDPHFYAKMWETLLAGDIWKGEIINKKKDGTLFTEEATISPVRDENGLTTNYIAVKRDITEEIELRTQLRQAQKMESLGTLAGGIAHDFNNMLSPILGYADILMDTFPEGGVEHHHSKEIVTAAERAKNLVEQILQYSRETEETLKVIDATAVIQQSLKLLHSSTPANITVEEDISSDDIHIYADATHIHQIIMNLYTNALHALPAENGRITITLSTISTRKEVRCIGTAIAPGNYLCLNITDNGEGIDEKTKEHMFDPFYTTKEVGKGTGLGLFTVHKIIKRYSGGLIVSSEKGKGTTFILYIPLADEKPLPHERSTSQNENVGSLKILVVDDEQSVATMLETMLGHLGHSCTVTTSSLEALELVTRNPDTFDLVITDQMMPEMSGENLILNIHELKSTMPILMITGYTKNMKNMKKNDYPKNKRFQILKKPLLQSALSKAIEDALHHNDGEIQ